MTAIFRISAFINFKILYFIQGSVRIIHEECTLVEFNFKCTFKVSNNNLKIPSSELEETRSA